MKRPSLQERKAQSEKNAAVLVAGCEKRFSAGEMPALMEAIFWCAQGEVAMPPWVAAAFQKAFKNAVWDLKHPSWDDVFGAPYPKHWKVDQRRRYQKIGFNVFERVRILRSKRPKPADIFRIVGSEFNISEATAKRFFARQQQWWDEASQILEEKGR